MKEYARHHHDDEYLKAVSNRLKKAKGHLQTVINWIEEDKECTEVLTQLSAVIGALNSTGRIILGEHLENCIVDAAMEGDAQSIKRLREVIESYSYK